MKNDTGAGKGLTRAEVDAISKIVLDHGPSNALDLIRTHPKLFQTEKAVTVALTLHALVWGLPPAGASAVTAPTKKPQARKGKPARKKTDR